MSLFDLFKRKKHNDGILFFDNLGSYVKFAVIEMTERLEKLFNTSVYISEFKNLEIFVNELPVITGNEEERSVCVVFRVKELIPGKLIFLVNEDSAKKIFKNLDRSGKNFLKEEGELSEEAKSLLESVAQIFCYSFVSAISNLLNKKILVSVPSISYSFKLSIINDIVLDQVKSTDKIYLYTTKMRIESKDIDALFFYIPDKIENLGK